MDSAEFIITLLILTGAALSTRVAGAVLMRSVKPSPRVEQFLEGLSVSVIAALVATQMMKAEADQFTAVGVAVLIVLATKNVILGMAGGMLVAALVF